MSPLHQKLLDSGAVMGEVAGFERPNWYAFAGESKYRHTYGKPNWFEACQRECELVQNSVGLFDQSSYPIFKVVGPEAMGFLNYLSANQVDVRPGEIVYTQWLNESGGIESDVTITRLSSEEFMVVGACASSRRDYCWMRQHSQTFDCLIKPDKELCILGVMGPNSRDLLASLMESSDSIHRIDYYSSALVEFAGIGVRANRLSYVGELGYELYVDRQDVGGLVDLISQCETDIEVGLAGFHAMNACRMEKGYRHWGHDIHDHIDPYSAGLSFVVNMDSGDFLGREALQKTNNVKNRRLVNLAIEEDGAPFMIHDEPVYRNGQPVGLTTSAAWGHRVKKSLAMADLSDEQGIDAEWIRNGEFEVEVATTRYPVSVRLNAFYDPKQTRLKA